MDFRAHIRSLAKNRRCLEIGPSYNPILPKAEGFDVTVFDHASQAQLREKYGRFGIDTAKIEEVDRIGTDIGQLRGEAAHYDLIVASHLIEHTTDLIAFLSHSHALLSDAGVLALIVPDKRYSFDIYRPLTSAGAAIDAHLSGRASHRGALFDHYANFVLNGGQMAWGDGDRGQFAHIHGPSDAASVLKEAQASSDYVDAHEWVFTPSSFRLVMHDLAKAGLTPLREVFSHASVGYEFLVILGGTGPTEDLDRITLQQDVAREELASLLAILGRSPASGMPHAADFPLTTREMEERLRGDSRIGVGAVAQKAQWKLRGVIRRLARR